MLILSNYWILSASSSSRITSTSVMDTQSPCRNSASPAILVARSTVSISGTSICWRDSLGWDWSLIGTYQLCKGLFELFRRRTTTFSTTTSWFLAGARKCPAHVLTVEAWTRMAMQQTLSKLRKYWSAIISCYRMSSSEAVYQYSGCSLGLEQQSSFHRIETML